MSLASREQEIREAKAFELVFRRQYDITLFNTPAQALAAMESTPAFSTAMKKLPEDRQRAFVADFTATVEENGGVLEAPMRYSMYLLRKK